VLIYLVFNVLNCHQRSVVVIYLVFNVLNCHQRSVVVIYLVFCVHDVILVTIKKMLSRTSSNKIYLAHILLRVYSLL